MVLREGARARIGVGLKRNERRGRSKYFELLHLAGAFAIN